MPYTIGTSHGPFTGTGSFVIAKPAGIRTIVTNIPAWTGHENESPRRYFRLGRFTLGNSHGFSESQLLEYAQQLVYPIPAIWELLAYDINDGASCTFYELVAVPDLTALQPWDRTPLPWTRSFNVDTSAVVSDTTGWTYTVPTARKLWLASWDVWISCATSTAAGQRAIIWAKLNGNYVAQLIMYSLLAGQRQVASIPGAPLILSPGDVLSVTYQVNGSVGMTAFGSQASGFLFDA